MRQTQGINKKLYDLRNRATGERHLVLAWTADEACKKAGGLIGDFYVVETKQYQRWSRGKPVGAYLAVPCATCPYQYAECKRPPEGGCIVKPDAPDMTEWLKRATEAHLCPHVGESLTKKDHLLKQKWETRNTAIEELSRQ